MFAGTSAASQPGADEYIRASDTPQSRIEFANEKKHGKSVDEDPFLPRSPSL